MFEVTQNDLNCSLKNYGFLCDTIFSSRVRMRTNHLATKCNYNARLLNIEILLVCRECLKKAWCGHWSLSQYWIGSLWGETCCSVIDGKCGKICRVGLYAELFYATIPTLFLCFLLICYHYTFLMVFILVVSIDLVALCVLLDGLASSWSNSHTDRNVNNKLSVWHKPWYHRPCILYEPSPEVPTCRRPGYRMHWAQIICLILPWWILVSSTYQHISM